MNPTPCTTCGEPRAWRKPERGAWVAFCATCDEQARRLAVANDERRAHRLPPLEKLPEPAPAQWSLADLDRMTLAELQATYDETGLVHIAQDCGVCHQVMRRYLHGRGVTLRGAGNPAQAKLNAISYDLFAEVAA